MLLAQVHFFPLKKPLAIVPGLDDMGKSKFLFHFPR